MHNSMMRKGVIALLLLAIVGFNSLAFAGPTLYSDVPEKHWAYDAISKLAQDGIVSGYSDGTFRGDHTLTRYEMAQMVANAMTKVDKADAQDKVLINKLSIEFADELKSMDIRLTTVENKVSNIKFSGDVRYRWERTTGSALREVSTTDAMTGKKVDNPVGFTRFRLNMLAPVSEEFIFVGQYQAESLWGTYDGTLYRNGANAAVNEAFLMGKAFGGTIQAGRLPLTLGKGLLVHSDSTADGVVYNFGKEVRVMLAAGKLRLSDIFPGNRDYNIVGAQVSYNFNKNFEFVVTVDKDKSPTNQYKDIAIGFTYTGIKGINVTTETSQNHSDWANSLNNGSAAKAYWANVKYLGANAAKKGSYGAWVGYHKIDPGYDYLGMATNTNDTTEASRVIANGIAMTGTDNSKGFEIGYEVALFKNGIFSAQYNHIKDTKTGQVSSNSYIGSLTYRF